MNPLKAYFLIVLVSSILMTGEAQPLAARFLQLVSASRTDTLYKRCPNPRAQFYARQYNDSQSWGRQQTAASLNWDGDALIYDYLTNDTNGASQQIKDHLGSTIIYIVFMAIGLLLMVIFAPIMVCCCCNPEGCPPCCRKQEGETYTSCERRWPAFAIVFLCIVAIAAMVGILIVNPELQRSYKETRCSTSILLDDLINGNYTKDGSQYFIGLKPLKANLTPPLASSPFPNDATLLLDQIVSEIEAAQEGMANIPGQNGMQVQLSYPSPLNLSPSDIREDTQRIPSIFGSILGTKNTPDSLIGQTYDSLRQLKSMVTGASPLSQVGILNTSALSQYAQLTEYAETMDKNTDSKLQEIQDKYIDPISIIIYIMAGLAVAFCLVLILASLSICCCDKFSCRSVVYFSCTILTLMGLLCFILSIATSLATAGSHYGCHYVEGSLQTKAEFQYRFRPIFNNDLLTKMVAECVAKEGTGIVVNSTQPVASSPSSLASIINQVAAYKKNLTSSIQGYHRARVLDIDSLSDIRVLQKMSDSSQYRCGEAGFSSDSWIPSTSQQSIYVPCKLQGMPAVTSQTCKSLTEFEEKKPHCVGCIDTFSILEQFKTHQEVLDSLSRRYPSPTCLDFNKELSNLWANFYKQKADVLGPVEARANEVSGKIDNIISLTGQLPKVVKQPAPLGAVVTQLNCKVLGEDVELVTNTFCTQVFNFAFKMRVLSIMGSFCLLLIMFCSTCLGMRSYNAAKTRLAPGSENELDARESENIFYLNKQYK